MGNSSWSDAAFRSISAGRVGAEVFRGERSIDPLMDPRHIRVREARDSEHHPESVPILVAFDVTASMGEIPTRFATSLLGALMGRLVGEGWVKDPQLCFAAVGDAVSDRAPFQVGQFESGLEMDMWLTRIWLEANGGDPPESYLLPHWFAAHHTATDAWEKRRKKGYLFTIGDAENKPITAAQIQRVFGVAPTGIVSDEAVIAAAAERYHLFHILVTRPGPPSATTSLWRALTGAPPAPTNPPPAPSLVAHWRRLLGDRVVFLESTASICELMGVILGVSEGRLSRDAATGILRAAGLSPEPVLAAIG